MKIHPELEKYYGMAGENECSNITMPTPDGHCAFYTSCGPYPQCLSLRDKRVPCRYCAFWTGYFAKDFRHELNQAIIDLERLREGDFDG